LIAFNALLNSVRKDVDVIVRLINYTDALESASSLSYDELISKLRNLAEDCPYLSLSLADQTFLFYDHEKNEESTAVQQTMKSLKENLEVKNKEYADLSSDVERLKEEYKKKDDEYKRRLQEYKRIVRELENALKEKGVQLASDADTFLNFPF